MASSAPQDPYPREWRVKYRAAIFQTNGPEMMKRLSDAEDAIVQRIRELFRDTGADVEEERAAMDDVSDLKASKIVVEQKTRFGLTCFPDASRRPLASVTRGDEISRFFLLSLSSDSLARETLALKETS